MVPEFPVAAMIVEGARLYALLGALAAVIFLLVGLDRCEPNARGAYAFRPLLFPGLLLLWPYVLWRWWRIERKGEP